MGYDNISPETLTNLLTHLSRNAEVREAAKKILGKGRYDLLASADLPFFIDFLRSDDPNKSVEQMVEERLNSGLTLRPKAESISAVGDIRVPFKTVDGVVQPAVDVTQYRDAIGRLDEFASKNALPSNIKPKTISVRIAATQADFEAKYNAISATERNLSTAQGVNFTLRPDGSEVKRSTDISGDLTDKRTVILLNHEVNASTKGEFGGEDSIAETLLHEYGHTVHRSMGLDWGDPEVGDSNPKTAKYQAVRGQRVSDYGENNDQEHFAETFAQYLYSGSATEEFKSFLENEVGIKSIDLNKIYPEMFRGTRLKDLFLQTMAEANLDGYSLKLNRHESSLGRMSQAEMQRDALAAQTSGRMPELKVYLDGTVVDSNGRQAGVWQRTFHRDSNGKIWVYHNYFKMDESAQGDGFGSKFIDRSFKLYKEDLGADRVEVTAALENGPYMWGIMGFDFKVETDKTSKLKNLRDHMTVLSEYASIPDRDNLSVTELAQRIQTKLAQSGDLIAERSGESPYARIQTMIQEARRNGWTISNDFINEMKFLLELPPSQVTANRIANLGRENRTSKGKKYSSLGRIIMMDFQNGSWRVSASNRPKGSWQGRLYLADWKSSEEKAKEDQAK